MKKEDWVHFVLCAVCGIVGACWLLIFLTVVRQHWPKRFNAGPHFTDARPLPSSSGKLE